METTGNEGKHQRMWTRLRRGAIVLGASGAGVALVSGAALAANTSINRTYQVKVKPMAIAKGSTVKATVHVANPETKVNGWWSQKTVTKVVQKGVNGGFQSPYQTQGFACKPVVKGQNTKFTCTLKGADVPTVVTIRFNVVFRGNTPSG